MEICLAVYWVGKWGDSNSWKSYNLLASSAFEETTKNNRRSFVTTRQRLQKTTIFSSYRQEKPEKLLVNTSVVLRTWGSTGKFTEWGLVVLYTEVVWVLLILLLFSVLLATKWCFRNFDDSIKKNKASKKKLWKVILTELPSTLKYGSRNSSSSVLW